MRHTFRDTRHLVFKLLLLLTRSSPSAPDPRSCGVIARPLACRPVKPPSAPNAFPPPPVCEARGGEGGRCPWLIRQHYTIQPHHRIIRPPGPPEQGPPRAGATGRIATPRHATPQPRDRAHLAARASRTAGAGAKSAISGEQRTTRHRDEHLRPIWTGTLAGARVMCYAGCEIESRLAAAGREPGAAGGVVTGRWPRHVPIG